MTICIAAICEVFENQHGIVFCADRLLSSGLEFEGNPKIKIIEGRCVILEAGNALTSDLVLSKNFFDMSKSAKDVGYVAKSLYQKILNLRDDIIDRQVLYKYGVSLKNIAKSANNFSDTTFRGIIDEIQDIDLELEFIVAGIDSDGSAHIYVVTDKSMSCVDSVGFVSIGSGSSLSLVEMTRLPNDGETNLSEMIVKVYASKKNSERTAGVGKETDLGVLYPSYPADEVNAGLLILKDDIKQILDEELDKIQKSELKIKDKIVNKITAKLYAQKSTEQNKESPSEKKAESALATDSDQEGDSV